MAETLFGLIGTLNPSTLIIIFISLIILLIIFETAIEHLEEFAVDAGYEDLLRRLYKEMMMMGYLSFGIFLAFNAAGVKHNQKYLAFEFSHITTFFIAIFFVVRACLFVRYTRAAKDYFQNVDADSISTLMKRYKNLEESPRSFEALIYKYFPSFSSLRISIEYQILKAHFFKFFRLISSEFRYANYLSKNYKFYVIKLTEIRPICWIGPIILILINYFRVLAIGDVALHKACHENNHHHSYSGNYSESENKNEIESTNNEDFTRLLSSNDDITFHINHTCEEYLIRYALFCSGLLILFACAIAIITIQSKNKLLVHAGIKSEGEVFHVLKRLLLEEKYRKAKTANENITEQDKNIPSITTEQISQMNDSNQINHENKNVDTSEFRRENRIRPHREGSFLSFTSIPQEEYEIRTLRVLLNIQREKKESDHHQLLHYVYHFKTYFLNLFYGFGNHNSHDHKPMTPMMQRVQSLRVRANKQKEIQISSSPKSSTKNFDHEMNGDIEVQVVNTGEFDMSNHSNNESDTEEKLNIESHSLAQELNSIFPFSSRSFYEFLIQQMLLLDSLFLALWATNLITISLHSDHPILFNLLFLIPIFFMTSLDFVILFLSSVLFAITSLNNKGSEWICEQDEICHKVLPQLRKEVLDLLPEGIHDKKIEELFHLVSIHQAKKSSIKFSSNNLNSDIDNDIELSPSMNREGFAQFLQSLNIHPSEKEVRALFRSMDKDDSGSIEVPELKALLTDPNMKMKPPKKKSYIDI